MTAFGLAWQTACEGQAQQAIARTRSEAHLLDRVMLLLRCNAQDQLVFPGQQPPSPSLHHDIVQSPLRFRIRVDGQCSFQQGFKLRSVLLADGDGLCERDERRRQMSPGEPDLLVEMGARSHYKIALCTLP